MHADPSSRRGFLKKSALLAAAGVAASSINKLAGAGLNLAPPGTVSFELPPLPYAFDALEPAIDKMTMEIHYGKHHAAYVANLNKAMEKTTEPFSSPEEIIRNISKYPVPVRNNGGGHYNHSLFWKIMKPGGGGQPSGPLSEAINTAFGSFDNFRTKFTEAAVKHFGSGWAWLLSANGRLEIASTPNQDNPLMDTAETRGIPLLGIDVWEHAYYLKYQNRRAEYVNAWWSLVNWDAVSDNLRKR